MNSKQEIAGRKGLSIALRGIFMFSLTSFLPLSPAAFGDVGEHWLDIIPLEIRIDSGNDDVEELNLDGDMYLDSSDLELTNDVDRGNQTIGLRFNNIPIDQGARLYNAYIRFTVDETENANPCNLTFRAQAVDNAEPFTSDPHNVTSRGPVTLSEVTWSPLEWETVGEAGENQITPSITAVIQEIIDRPGWVSGNSIVLTITGTGTRIAESFEGNPTEAPLLYVEVASTVEHWLNVIPMEIRIDSGNNDVEELNGSGDMYLNSSDLELTNDSDRGNQTVGLRFNNIQIDQGARIYNAYIQFTVDETEYSNPCHPTFMAQAVDNAEPFTTEPYNVTSRWPVTSARATWSPVEWDTVGAAGYDQITPRITAVIQEIIDRPGWVRGNSIVLIITGTGKRVVKSYEGSPTEAPLLCVEVGPTDGDVNLKDFAVLGNDWLETGPVLAADANGDNTVDFDDLRILATSWLRGCDQIDSYSQYSYSVYFICNQNVTDTSISNFDQETLDYFWDYIAELEDTGMIDMPEPADLQDCNEPEYCPYIYLTDEESKRVLAAKTAHSIYLDKNDILPWKLTEYTNDELEGLFNPNLLFSVSGSQYYYFSVVDHSPSDVYGYLVDNQLIEGNVFDTFYAVLENLRADFRHGSTSLGDPTSTAYTIRDALTTYVANNMRVSRRGCHSMTRIAIGMLRSINIPGEETNDGTWFNPGHSSAVWLALETVLPHGDNIYNALIRATPTDEFLPTFTFFDDNLDTEPCGDSIPCLSHRHMVLNGITYPPDYTLARCCDPVYYGYQSCRDYMETNYGAYLTEDELNNAVTTLESLCE